MAINTDLVDGDPLPASGVFKHVYSDNTGGNLTSSVAETTVVTYTIPANSVATGIFVMAPIRFINQDSGGASSSGTFKLKIAGSTVKTIDLISWDHGVGSASNKFGTSFMYFDTSADYTGAVTVLITAQNSDTQNTAWVDSFHIFGF